MKYLLFIFSLCCFLSCSDNKKPVQNSEKKLDKPTTYFMIRHAEKDRTNPENEDPKLNEAGLKRAQKWADVFSKTKLDAIYSSAYKRTTQTAKPTALTKGLPIKSYDPHKVYSSNFFETTNGLQVLVVGHSNTVPKLANFILGEERYKNIPDSINSRLYIVTKNGESTSSLILDLD